MDVEKILAGLRAERQQIEEAIVSLERLARARGPRRGRPPAWLAGSHSSVEAMASAGPPEAPRPRGRPPGSKNKTKEAAMTAEQSSAAVA